ncbi:putative amidohydrolase [Sporosarcina luteola]|nr:putative amidohydrolase [Sporosarcina luteola]
MKVAIAQFKTSTDKEENLQKAISYIHKSGKEGADFVILPEFFMGLTLGDSAKRPVDYAEPIDGSFVQQLCSAAKENHVYVIGGIFELSDEDVNRAHNTTVVINKQGKLLYRYRKTHLCDSFSSKESDTIIPGKEAFPIIETEFGKLGLVVCYELRFPEVTRQLILNQADFIIVSSAWYNGILKEDHWEVLLRARAIENTTFMIAANQTGNIFSGRSMIVDPMGVVVSSTGEEEDLIVTTIDLDRIQRVRNIVSNMEHRRPELYGNLIE